MEPKFFKYKARDRNGYDCAGTVKAESEEAARLILENKDLKPFFLELDTDATRRVSLETLRQQKTIKRKKSLKGELLSYGMPLCAILIALSGIPIAMHYMKPPSQNITPAQQAEKYFEFERAGKYKEQFELLSTAVQQSYGSREKYEERKRLDRMADDTVVYQTKIERIELVHDAPRRKELKVHVLRPSGTAAIMVQLIPSKGKWSIDYVRDPDFVEKSLQALAKAEEKDHHQIIAELKKITAYSDLDIENLRKKYLFDGRKALG